MKCKILIVDDDSRNIFALHAVLKAKGYGCASTTSAKDALALLEKDRSFDVVLMDMMMPEMDGYQAIKAMHAHPQLASIPVIAVTAQAMDGDREKCLEAGAAGYLSKPINVDDLVSVLEKY
ncbi:MAG: response regulator [Sphingobacteriales bacterium]|nr:MAG: response regulator [Sphingobacteriales bacterium]